MSGEQKLKQLWGWMGVICLILIVPVKAIRWVDDTTAQTMAVGVAPSILGPAGLLFLMLSSSGKLSRLSLLQAALLVGVIALGLEFAQLLPRPGILAKVYYTFDWLDVIASVFSISIGYFVARLMIHTRNTNHKQGQKRDQERTTIH